MSQENGGMFGKDFFPTPRQIGRKMVAKISKEAHYFLEPSAGKGDLADVIRRPTTYEELEAEHPISNHKRYSRYATEDRKVVIDCIESHPGLAAVCRGKEYAVVGYDWLDYCGTSYYDAIVMNPPFSEGVKHLLKAWDFLYDGEIVCLLNEETIKNPYTEERRRLASIIESARGEVEYLGDCFSTAERKADVRVAMVYLKKAAPDDTADMWAKEATQEKQYHAEVGGDPNFIAIRDKLGNMEHWYNLANEHFVKGIEHLRKAQLYLSQNKVSDSSARGSHEKSFSSIAGTGMQNVGKARAEFYRLHRQLAWTSVFEQMEFRKWLDSRQSERFMRDVERDSTIPFTAENIKATLENVFLTRKKLFTESVANVFDDLCSHAVENGSGPVMPGALKGNWRFSDGGWKTNDSYKVNEKLIFPHGVRYDILGFRAQWSTEARTLNEDLDRILCVLDGQSFDECLTVGKALDMACRRVNRRTTSGGWTTESQYFLIRFFKKGTVHLKWKRRDLWESFNKTAAAGKKWLGAETSYKKAEWRSKPDYYCQHHGHEYINGVCNRCEKPEVDPLEKVTCELCRAVLEETGIAHCPLHPLEQKPMVEDTNAPVKALEPVNVTATKPKNVTNTIKARSNRPADPSRLAKVLSQYGIDDPSDLFLES